MAWAAKGAARSRRAQDETYLVHCLARDQKLSERFANLYKIDREFHKKIDRFLAQSPIFQAAWLQKNAIPDWDPAQDRRIFIEKGHGKTPPRTCPAMRRPAATTICWPLRRSRPTGPMSFR